MNVYKSLLNEKITKFIKDGQIGIIPTDTIYGLVTAAGNKASCTRMYKLKSRHAKPGTIIAANINQLVELGIPRRYLKAVQDYWPGSVSVVIPAGNDLDYLHLGKLSLACRIPQDKSIRKLLLHCGPLLTSSANQPGQPPATNLKEAQAYFNDKVDFYVDGGDLSKHLPSTVIRIVDDAVEVLREGAVKIDEVSGSIIS